MTESVQVDVRRFGDVMVGSKSHTSALVVALACVILGVTIGFGQWAPALVILGVAVVCASIQWSIFGLLSLCALSTNLLGVADGLQQPLRIGGAIDLTVGAIVLAIVVVGSSWLGSRNRPALSSNDRLVVAALLFVVGYALARAIGTSVQFGFSPALTIGAARRYGLYLVPLGILAICAGSGQAPTRLAKLLVGTAASYSLVVVLAWLAGSRVALAGFRVLSGVVDRAYPTAYGLSLVGAALAMSMLIAEDSRRQRPALLVAAALCAAAVLVTGSRAALIALGVTVVAVFVFEGREPARGKMRSMPASVIGGVLVVALLAVSFAALGFAGRFSNLAAELAGQGGTVGYRMNENQFRLAMVAQSPVWGVGFVPYDLAASVASGYQGITHLETVDSGLVTLLVDFGAVGVVWVVALVAACLGAYRHWARRGLRSPIWRAAVGYLLGGLVTIPTQGHFTLPVASLGATALIIGLALGESAWLGSHGGALTE